jgi:hypothetical protein
VKTGQRKRKGYGRIKKIEKVKMKCKYLCTITSKMILDTRKNNNNDDKYTRTCALYRYCYRDLHTCIIMPIVPNCTK